MKSLTGILLMVIAQFIICGCTNGRKDYRDIVAEWIGKEILFPDSMETLTGERFVLPTADFTIVSYYDSAGCTGCRMRLQLWEEFMRKVDSVRGNRSVDLVLVAALADADELRFLSRRYGFAHILLHDSTDTFNRLNQFPEDSRLQTFLLNRSGKVMVIGNPLDGKGIENLYLSNMGNAPLDDDSEEYEHDFGKLVAGESRNHTFRMRNESGDTLRVRDIITSCECTEGRVSAKEIAPGDSYEVTVSFRDTITGEFYRSVTLLFENKKTEICFAISGVIINHNNKSN